jgi:citrate synthase
MPSAEKPVYSPGLEGVIAGETSICWVDPDAGLLYRGYDVEELASRVTFEACAWLLLHGELPSEEQEKAFSAALTSAAPLPVPVLQMLGLLPRTMHPIDALRTGVSMLAGFDPDLDDRSHEAGLRKAERLIARVSSLITAFHRTGQQEQVRATGDSKRSFAARFLFDLSGKVPQSWEVAALNTVLILYLEHEFNASTFSARVTASTLSDMYAAVTSAIGTLKGALHGGANEAAMDVLREVGTPADAAKWVAERLARHEKVMGFGHRVYRKGDSRVPAMRELCRQLGQRRGETDWYDRCVALENEMARQKGMFANLDLYAAPVLHLLGIPAQLNTSVFACSRVVGWCAHVIEQHDHNRLIRPRAHYVGPPRRSLQKKSS